MPHCIPRGKFQWTLLNGRGMLIEINVTVHFTYQLTFCFVIDVIESDTDEIGLLKDSLVRERDLFKATIRMYKADIEQLWWKVGELYSSPQLSTAIPAKPAKPAKPDLSSGNNNI